MAAALGALTWDQELQAITLHELQTFLWHELPRKWLTDLEGKLHIAGALELAAASGALRPGGWSWPSPA